MSKLQRNIYAFNQPSGTASRSRVLHRRSTHEAKTGGRYWTRTSDPQFVRLMLYQLS